MAHSRARFIITVCALFVAMRTAQASLNRDATCYDPTSNLCPYEGEHRGLRIVNATMGEADVILWQMYHPEYAGEVPPSSSIDLSSYSGHIVVRIVSDKWPDLSRSVTLDCKASLVGSSAGYPWLEQCFVPTHVGDTGLDGRQLSFAEFRDAVLLHTSEDCKRLLTAYYPVYCTEEVTGSTCQATRAVGHR